MSKSENKDNILGYECRFAVYCPPAEEGGDDYHLVKEIIHHTDGTKSPNVRMIRNYKRPYWVTKKGCQNHKDKKEWESVDNLIRFEATQTQLVDSAARALGMPWFKGNLRKLAISPYLYGSDILSTAVIKRSYQDRFPDLISRYSLAVFDTETNVLDGSGQIIMATLSMGSKVFTAVDKNFVSGYSDVIPRLRQLLVKYLSAMETKDKEGNPVITNILEKRKIEWEVILVDSEADCVIECFKRAHQWKPDFLAIWNIDFDVPKIAAALERRGINPADVFSDPAVPRQARHFTYKRGPNKKVTASGLVTPIKPAAQWHTVYCPSSFYFIDAMCAYRHIRTGNAEESSYALDAILKKHELGGKLKFEEAEGMTGIDWHQFMQERHPLEYVVYNVFDCVSMEELDEKIDDLGVTLPLFSGCSDFENFKSQPRRLADSLHYFALKNNQVIGSTSSEMAQDFDKETIGLDGWIVTLPAHLVVDNGLQVIEEAPDMRTNIRAHVGDLDVSASYPNGGCVFNISKETTKRELIKIQGVPESVQRAQGINLAGGHTNAVEFVCGMYGLPSMEEMLMAFRNKTEL